MTAATLCVDAQPWDTGQKTLTEIHFHEAMGTVRPTQLTNTMRNEFREFDGTKGAGETGWRARAGHDKDDG